uniref:Immunoglobulin C1-set domain-containing protein n=1 Tax=Apteryx owenii TaxID=8824 RepID=A0A8B9QRR7_APTOW
HVPVGIIGLGEDPPLVLCGKRIRPHSLRYRYAAVSEPGLPGFVGVGFVDERPFLRYDSETQRARPQVAWAAEQDAVYWAEETQSLLATEAMFRLDLEVLRSRSNQSGGDVTSFHTWQLTYGCDLLEDGGIRGLHQHAYDGRDFLSFDKDMLTFTAGDAGVQVTKRKWEHYLERVCVEGLKEYVRSGKEVLEKKERPEVRLAAKHSYGTLVLSCRAHGFYPRPIKQETKRSSIVPSADGTYHAWATTEVLAVERDLYQCRVEHASLAEAELFSWELKNSLLLLIPAVLAAVLTAIVAAAGFVVRKKSSSKGPSIGQWALGWQRVRSGEEGETRGVWGAGCWAREARGAVGWEQGCSGGDVSRAGNCSLAPWQLLPGSGFC